MGEFMGQISNVPSDMIVLKMNVIECRGDLQPDMGLGS
jgi:hypothetical protein